MNTHWAVANCPICRRDVVARCHPGHVTLMAHDGPHGSCLGNLAHMPLPLTQGEFAPGSQCASGLTGGVATSGVCSPDGSLELTRDTFPSRSVQESQPSDARGQEDRPKVGPVPGGAVEPAGTL